MATHPPHDSHKAASAGASGTERVSPLAAARLMVYGMQLYLVCPMCGEDIYISTPFVGWFDSMSHGDRLLANILEASKWHRYILCDPTIRWMPEQLGYHHDPLPKKLISD